MGWKNIKYKTLYSLKIAISNAKGEKFIEYKIGGDYFIIMFKDAKVELKIAFTVNYSIAKQLYNDTVNKLKEKGFEQFKLIKR